MRGINKAPFTTITTAKGALQSKQVSVEEVINSSVKIARANKHNEFITTTDDSYLEPLIEASQKRIDEGKSLPLDGMPIAVKDIFCTKGIKTTCASKMLANFVPTYESTITTKLFKAGAIMVGKTNMDEFAMGSNTNTGFFGKCVNPHLDQKSNSFIFSPGGSSGGSAISVSTGSSIFALGTDTGGSVRQPAALCGVFGMKPTYGMCSRYGMISYASSFDQAGLLANSPRDLATIFDIISGFDERDSTSVPQEKSKFEGFFTTKGISGLNIAVIADSVLESVDTEIANAVKLATEVFATNGATVKQNVEVKYLEESLAVYFVVTPAECFSNLSRYDGLKYGYSSPDAEKITNVYDLIRRNRSEGFGNEVQRRLLMGAYVLAKENYENFYVHATKIRMLIRQFFDELFEKYDALVLPTTSSPANDPSKVQDPLQVYLNDQFTIVANCAGLPAISVPMKFNKDGLPLAVQIITRPFEDYRLIEMADLLFRQT